MTGHYIFPLVSNSLGRGGPPGSGREITAILQVAEAIKGVMGVAGGQRITAVLGVDLRVVQQAVLDELERIVPNQFVRQLAPSAMNQHFRSEHL